jgi:uncharacterized protein DUF4436
VIFLARPDGVTVIPSPPEPPAEGLGVIMIVEQLEPRANTATARIITEAGAELNRPVLLGSTISSLGEIKIDPEDLVKETTLELPLEGGDVTNYPFDRYTDRFTLLALTLERGDKEPEVVPMRVIIISSVAGFSGEATADFKNEGTNVAFELERTSADVTWAVIMMLINWALAAAAIGVVLAVVLGEREWESRHMAWLTAAVFALTAFRANAPGQPPLGTFFDFASFFWAEGIIAVMLLALVGRYLLVDRTRLGL